MTLVELKKFKQNMKEPCFVAWNSGKVTCNDKTYKIKYMNLCGKSYPYVEIPDTKIECEYQDGKKNRSELTVDENEKIRTINTWKAELKNQTYEFDGIEYTITGIGFDSIKLEKNYSGREEYYWYYTLRGKYLLNKLYEIVFQLNLI